MLRSFALVMFSCLVVAPSRAVAPQNCLSICECDVHWDNQQDSPTPPACFGSATFAFTGPKKPGCCQLLGSCLPASCQFEVEVSAQAAAGQVCDFEVLRGSAIAKSCSAASVCNYDGPPGEALMCGGTLVYTVRAGGVRVSQRQVHCMPCN